MKNWSVKKWISTIAGTFVYYLAWHYTIKLITFIYESI